MLALFKHSRNIIQKRWQQRSISYVTHLRVHYFPTQLPLRSTYADTHTHTHARTHIQTTVHNLEAFLDDESVFVVKKAGFELLIHFVDIMQDGLDETVMDLLMHALNFSSLIEEEDGDIKLPTFDIRS